jgi:hypothetical protein
VRFKLETRSLADYLSRISTIAAAIDLFDKQGFARSRLAPKVGIGMMLPVPFKALDYVLCAIVFFLAGIAFVPEILNLAFAGAK